MATTENRLKALLEQTSFLLTKQTEAQKECSELFRSLLKSISQKIDEAKNDSETKKILEEIHDLISGQAQRLFDEAQDDISFLEEQTSMLQDIQKEPSKEKRQEFLASVIEEDEELPDTEAFKKEVSQELELSRQSLVSVISDIKHSLDEGDAKQVKLLLESSISELEENAEEDDEFYFDDEDEEDDEDNDHEHEDEEDEKHHYSSEKTSSCCKEDTQENDEEDACCGSGCGSEDGCGSCEVSKDGIDIFSYLNSYDRELQADIEKEKKENNN